MKHRLPSHQNHDTVQRLEISGWLIIRKKKYLLSWRRCILVLWHALLARACDASHTTACESEGVTSRRSLPKFGVNYVVPSMARHNEAWWMLMHGEPGEVWWGMVRHVEVWWCMERHGDTWWGMVRHGDGRWCTVMHGEAWLCTVRHGGAWLGMVKHVEACWGMVNHGEAWWGRVRHGEAGWSMVRHGEAWWGMVRHGEAWWGTVRHSGVWLGIVRHGGAWCGMVRHGQVCRDESIKFLMFAVNGR